MALKNEVNPPTPTALTRGPGHSARSVHHFQTGLPLDATEIAAAYFKWLANQLMGMIGVDLPEVGKVDLLLFGMPAVRLVQREHNAERVSFAVVGGWLVRRPGGTFEFVNSGGGESYAVLDGFQPRLPWVLYRFTHAWVHDVVMRKFASEIKKTSQDALGEAE